MRITHRPDDVAVLELGALKLMLFIDPWGSSRALWFLRARGELLGGQVVGAA